MLRALALTELFLKHSPLWGLSAGREGSVVIMIPILQMKKPRTPRSQVTYLESCCQLSVLSTRRYCLSAFCLFIPGFPKEGKKINQYSFMDSKYILSSTYQCFLWWPGWK